MSFKSVISAAALAVSLGVAAGSANASMVLTAAGTAENFTLSTFASGFPTTGFCCGPLGIAFPNSGGVLVTDYPGNVRLFATDADGQLASSAPVGQFYGNSNAVGLAKAGGNIYMTQQGNQDLVRISDTGTFISTVATGLGFATGIAANPTNGHLYVSNVGGTIWDINPGVSVTALITGINADGLSTDGTTLYGAANGHILGYNIATHAQVFDSGNVGDVDGTALGTGVLAGKIYGNTNSGNVIEVDLASLAVTTIASGGSRGDFVTVDPNGSLLLTQTDSIVRLTPPSGGGFVGQTPEPASIALLGLGLAGLGFTRRRKR